MSKPKMTACMSLVSRMDEQDQDMLLDRLALYQKDGIPAERAQVMAASDTLAELEAERKEFMVLLREQHPDLFLVKPEIKKSERRQTETLEFKQSPDRYITSDEIDTMRSDAWDTLRDDPEYIRLGQDVVAAEEVSSNRWRDVNDKAVEILMSKPAFSKIAANYDSQTVRRLAQVFMQEADAAVPAASPTVRETRQAQQSYEEKYFRDVAKLPEPREFAEMANQQRGYYSSPAFKNWFKKSAAVDAQGSPLVAFHVTTLDFVEFNVDAGSDSGKKTSAAYSGQLGSWFTAPSLYANNYEAGNAETAVEQFTQDLDGGYKAGANTMPVHLSIQSPMEYSDFESMLEDRDSYPSIAAYKRSLIKDGHDGIVIRNSDTDGNVDRDDWVAFNATQIKSAIGNNGDFDATNPDIRKSERRSILGFTSALAKGIEDMPTKQALAGAWQAQIKGLVNKGVVKADELEWSGLNDWLELQGQPQAVYEPGFGIIQEHKADDGSWQQVDDLAMYFKTEAEAQAAITDALQSRAAQDGQRDGTEGRVAVQAMAGDALNFGKTMTPKITKAEIAEYLAQGGVRVEETVLGGVRFGKVEREELDQLSDIPRAQRTAAESLRIRQLQDAANNEGENPTKYERYTLPGGENYREVLLTLPEKNDGEVPAGWRLIDVAEEDRRDGMAVPADEVGPWKFKGPGVSSRIYKTREDALAALRKEAGDSPTGRYQSSHWDQPNVIVHIRVDDRVDADGARVLMVQEIQSDWGQEGKKKGFGGTVTKGTVFQQESGYWGVRWPDGAFSGGYSRESADQVASEGPRSKSPIPSAPFVTKTDGWLNLALKRVMIMAAEGGYDKVAFVNGEQSADRYDLSKQVDKISVGKVPSEMGAWQVIARKDGEVVIDRYVEDDSELAGLIGKDLADKAIAQGGGGFSGLDLKVGGEGMKTFYDQIIPQAVKKLLPKVGGGKLENVSIGTETEYVLYADNGQTVVFENEDDANDWLNENEETGHGEERVIPGEGSQPGFDVTPAMRDKVAGGLPLFSRRRSANEDGEDYTGAYETDLFGQALPEDDRARSGSGVEAATGGNLQPAAALRDTPAPQGEYFARTLVGSEVERKLGTDRILTPEQAAQATAYLYRSAVERMDGIITDIDGKPLAAVGGFKGALSQTSVYPATIMAEAVRVPGAARIWFSHNHPSGTATLSRADENLNGIMTDVFLGSGIEPMGLLAVTGKRFAHVDPSGNVTSGDMLAPTASMTVPAIERELADSDFQPMLIDTPTAAKMAAKTFQAKGGDGLILLNAKNEVVGWLPISDLMRGRLRNTGGLNAIYRALSESNAGAAILVHRGSLDVNGGFGGGVTVGNNIAAALVKADVRPLDSVNVATGASLAEQGGLIAAGPVFSRRRAETPEFNEDIPNEFWLQGKIDYASQAPRSKYGVPKMGSITGYFDDNVMVPVRWAKDVPGQNGEQGQVRQKDLDAIRQIIRDTGKMPLNDNGTEYVPYIEIGYDGKPWVSEGNHRIMAAAAEGLEYIPAEVRYFDGGQRRAGKWAPDNLLDITKRQADAKFSTRRQTETPQFKRWFGKSLVTEDETPGGTPKVMYHGSYRDIVEFNRLKSTEWRRESMDTVGSWFSDNPSKDGGAGMYAASEGARIYPVYLSITRPKVYTTFRDFLRDMHEAEGRELKEQNPPGIGSAEGLRDKLKAQGYDGIAFMQTDNQSLMDDIKETYDAVKRAQREEFLQPRDQREPFTMKRARLEQKLKSLRLELDEFGSSTEFDKQVVWVAFDPTQIKSAIGNDGSFDPANPDITKSTGRTSTGADWDSPSASKFDDMVYKIQDKTVDLKRVVASIREASGALADDLDTYLQEELYHGRTAKRTEDFVNMELTPLIEEMGKEGLSIADVEEYLHARHAPEANKVIAQRNPGVQNLQDGGSGMSTQDALDYITTLPADLKLKLEAAAAKVDAIIAKTNQLYIDYELESKDKIDGWSKMFDHYIPLQREDKDGSPGLGQGFSIKGKEVKGRTGSTRKVVDILANIALRREKAIVRGEKNRVSQSLVGLAQANPNDDFWQVDIVPTERVFNPATGLVEDRMDPMYKSRDNAVIAKIKDANGIVREHAVVFNEDDPRALRMASALKNLDATALEGLMGVSAKISRYFASINTQWNPVFGVVNLVRDVQGALLNLSSTPLKGDEKKIAKYTASALKGVYFDARAARKGSTPSSAWSQLWDEFQSVGGQTGYRDLFANSAERAEAIQKALDPNAWMDSRLGKIFTAGGALKVPLSEAKKGAGWIFNWLSDYNLAMENGVRLAAYKAGLERGLSKEQAASAAKNLTVNFNRKGQASQQAGALYAFFNASVQGTARIFQTVFTMEPGKPKTIRLSPVGQKIVYGGMLLGSMQAMALAAAGFNDDDPPEFVRERSLIIPLFNKKYITIPMPLGYHVLPNLGRISTEFVLSGFKDPHKRALSVASLFADTFNPIGNAGLSMQTLAPTALDPLVALTENKDYTGKPIARESFNKAIPGFTLGRDTATTLAKLMSEGINTLSGGNKYTSGVFSPTPDQIDYLIGQVTGGVGRELSKVEQSVLSTARGEELPTYKIPLVGRFVGDAKSQASEGTAFYANAERLNRLETEIKGLQKDGKTAEASELRRSSSESYLITMANQAERQIQKLRTEKRELIKADAPREKVKAIEERVTEVMARLNRASEALKEKSQ